MIILIYSAIIITLIIGLLTSKNIGSLNLKYGYFIDRSAGVEYSGGNRAMSIIILVLLSILITWIGVAFALNRINRNSKEGNMVIILSIAIGFFVACVSIGMILLR